MKTQPASRSLRHIVKLARMMRVAQERGTLFLIGPRRYGKTSILRAAEEEAIAGKRVAQAH